MGPINYIEKGYGLHEAVMAAGYSMWNNDGKWFADNPEAVQAIVDSYNPMPYEQGERIKALNEDYSARYQTIHANIPLYELINWNRQSMEARAWLAAGDDAKPETPMLTPLFDKLTAQGWPESLPEFMQRIMRRDAAYIEQISRLDAVRQLTQARIQATTEMVEAQMITWTFEDAAPVTLTTDPEPAAPENS